ncbi:MAG: carbohydrate kinase [Pirellula sp.]|jgi:fructokinase|nr:carbohydrate kinase [Pirellula sp.]
MNKDNPWVVVGLGEILWDVFEDATVFGGAPANFACHAAALGLEALMKSAVGNDDLGHQALDWIRKRDLSVDFVREDSEHPTGTVRVRLRSDGQPEYVFASDVAWDHLRCDPHDVDLAQRCHAVCFGTLAQRSLESRQAIQRFVESTPKDAWRILDVNLRQNFYDEVVLRESVLRSNALKLNDEEWPIVSSCLGIDSEPHRKNIEAMAAQYGLRCIVLTRGKQGSWIWLDGEWDECVPTPIDAADTVGAGDAFTAAVVAGLLRGEPVSKLHRRASRIASYVCTQRGATPPLPTWLLAES